MSTNVKRCRSSSIDVPVKVPKHREEVTIPFLYPAFDATSPDTSYFPNFETVTEDVAEEHTNTVRYFLQHVLRRDALERLRPSLIELVCCARRLYADQASVPLSFLDIATSYNEMDDAPKLPDTYIEDRDRAAARAKQLDKEYELKKHHELIELAMNLIRVIAGLVSKPEYRVPAHLVWCATPSSECICYSSLPDEQAHASKALFRDMMDLLYRVRDCVSPTAADVAWLAEFASIVRATSHSRSLYRPNRVREELEIGVNDVLTYKHGDTIKKGHVVSIMPCMDVCMVESESLADVTWPRRVSFNSIVSKDKAVVG